MADPFFDSLNKSIDNLVPLAMKKWEIDRQAEALKVKNEQWAQERAEIARHNKATELIANARYTAAQSLAALQSQKANLDMLKTGDDLRRRSSLEEMASRPVATLANPEDPTSEAITTTSMSPQQIAARQAIVYPEKAGEIARQLGTLAPKPVVPPRLVPLGPGQIAVDPITGARKAFNPAKPDNEVALPVDMGNGNIVYMPKSQAMGQKVGRVAAPPAGEKPIAPAEIIRRDTIAKKSEALILNPKNAANPAIEAEITAFNQNSAQPYIYKRVETPSRIPFMGPNVEVKKIKLPKTKTGKQITARDVQKYAVEHTVDYEDVLSSMGIKR